MLVLLLHHDSINESSSLHLEGEDVGNLTDPGSLRGLVPLTIFVVLVVWDITTDNILPGLVKVVFILDVQDDIMLSLR